MRVGPYELLEKLGQGGMGEVWRARHVELGAVRALKRTLRKDGQLAERFEREARALALVRHPSVVVVHEVGREPDGTAWLAMELVEGEPLDRLLARGPLPLARALEVGAQVARGVAALHAAGVVHRDLKPANVVLRPDGRAVLLDLGIALSAGERERLTRTGGLVGTPAYMAPEQVVVGEAGPPSDVHGLGLVLFDLVTGRVAREDEELLLSIARGGTAVRPSTVDDGLPAALDDLVAAATDLDPARRPTATGLASALEALALHPGPSCRARRRRRRLAVGGALAAVAAGALLGGLGLADTARPPAPSLTPSLVSTRTLAAAPAGGLNEALAAARRLAPAARREALVAWVAAHRGDPALAEAEALLAPLLRDAPRWAALRPGARGALFVGADLVAVGVGSEVELLDVHSGGPRGTITIPGKVEALAVVPGPRPVVLVATIGPNGLLRVDPADRSVTRVPWPPVLTPDDVAVSRDGRRAVVDVRDGDPRLLDLTGADPPVGLGPHDGPVSCVAFDLGSRVLSGSTSATQARLGENTLRVWAPGGELVHRLLTVSRTTAIAPIHGAARLLVGTTGGQLLFVDGATGTACGQLLGDDLGDQLRALRAHLAPVRRLVVALDGARAVSAAGDLKGEVHELAVRDLARDALLRRFVRPAVGGRAAAHVEGLDLDPTGEALLVTDAAGAVERWDLGPLVGE